MPTRKNQAHRINQRRLDALYRLEHPNLHRHKPRNEREEARAQKEISILKKKVRLP